MLANKPTTVFTAFLWGAYVFREPLKDLGLSLFALFVMAIGMIGVGVSVSEGKSFLFLHDIWLKLKSNTRTTKNCQQYSCVQVKDSSKPLLTSETTGNPILEEECRRQKYERETNFMKGMLCAILVGTLNGSFMIPLKYANKYDTEALTIDY
eukprot:Gb_18400 [translate_table: standard]